MKKDYVIVTKDDANTIDTSIQSIRRQADLDRLIVVCSEKSREEYMDHMLALACDGIIDVLVFEDVGLAHARALGISEVRTEWFVFIDGDVVLPDDWAGLMGFWGVRGASFGHVYRNAAHNAFLRKTVSAWPTLENRRMYTHNTIIKTDLVTDWHPPHGLNAYEDFLLTRHILTKGATIMNVPVFAFHDHQGSVFRAAAWNGVGARQTGFVKTRRAALWRAMKTVISGIGNSLKMNNDWFFAYGLRQATGFLWGYLRG